MSFLSRWFGGGGKSGGDAPAEPTDKVTAEIEYNGFTIRAVPYKHDGQFQTAGIVEKEIAGTRRVHRFVRADRSTAIEEATELSLAKGRLIVDQQGVSIFE